MKQLLLFISFFVVSSLMLFAQTKSYKRGVSYNIPYAEDLEALTPGLSWYYNWGQTPTTAIIPIYSNYNMEYVPMAWSGLNKATMRGFLTGRTDVKYILGFNEPNFVAQANLTPTKAASMWSDIEEIADEFNLKIVGPALNYSPDAPYQDPFKWYDEFLAACPDCRIDYIAAHCYMDNPGSLSWYLSLYERYNKPIWLTEYCAWDGNKVTPQSQREYMIQSIFDMENNPQVYRYAWFIGRSSGGEQSYPYMPLLSNTGKGNLTELGDIYVNMSSFDSNHYFMADRDTIQAEKMINGNSISLRRMNDKKGNLYLDNFFFKDWAQYSILVPELGISKLTFRIACDAGAVLQVLNEDGMLLASSEIQSTGGLANWSYRALDIVLPPGKQKITLKSMGEACSIDWFTFRDIEASVTTVQPVLAGLASSLVFDELRIETDLEQLAIRILDSMGREVLKVSDQLIIPVSHLDSGVYIVQLSNNTGAVQHIKFIKQ